MDFPINAGGTPKMESCSTLVNAENQGLKTSAKVQSTPHRMSVDVCFSTPYQPPFPLNETRKWQVVEVSPSSSSTRSEHRGWMANNRLM